MNEKTDLRVVKTKRDIKSAMISLLNEKDFRDITVQNVLDRALINRATFYRYYKDKYDLADQLCASCLDGARKILDEQLNMRRPGGPIGAAQKLYDYMLCEKNTIDALSKVKTEKADLYESFRALLKSSCLAFLNTNRPELSAEFTGYSAALYAAAVLTTIDWLAENTKSASLSESEKEALASNTFHQLSRVLDGIFKAE